MMTTLRPWASIRTAIFIGITACLAGQALAQSDLAAPGFVPDPTWPMLPDEWVLGEVTSVSIDRNDKI